MALLLTLLFLQLSFTRVWFRPPVEPTWIIKIINWKSCSFFFSVALFFIDGLIKRVGVKNLGNLWYDYVSRIFCIHERHPRSPCGTISEREKREGVRILLSLQRHCLWWLGFQYFHLCFNIMLWSYDLTMTYMYTMNCDPPNSSAPMPSSHFHIFLITYWLQLVPHVCARVWGIHWSMLHGPGATPLKNGSPSTSSQE